MKRFTSILCALCLIVGVLSGVALAPAEEAKATQEPAIIPAQSPLSTLVTANLLTTALLQR